MSLYAGTQAVSLDAVSTQRGQRPPDGYLLGIATVLVGLGLVMVASATVTHGGRDFSEPLHFFWRQLGHAGLGALFGFIVLQVELESWQRVSGILLLIGIVLLALVLIPGIGREVNGSMRWLAVGPLRMQPSEPVKLLMPIYLAGYLVRRSAEVQTTLWGFAKPLVVLGLIAVLFLMEPDYGATVVLFATILGMLFLGGVPLASFSLWVAFIGTAMAAIVIAAPYRVERLTTFMNPWADPFDSGFQLTQALIAIGRGEWFGVGLGDSVQKLFYLPEAHTDFLFAVLGEELGFAGMAFVIIAFSALVWRCFVIARRAEHRGQSFAAYLCYGLGLAFGLQAFINIGVNMGLLPTKGLVLPLMSYGGSSLVMNCIAVAFILRADYEAGRTDGEH